MSKAHRLGGDYDAEANRLGIKSVKCFNGSRCRFEVLECSSLAVVAEATSLRWRL